MAVSTSAIPAPVTSYASGSDAPVQPGRLPAESQIQRRLGAFMREATASDHKFFGFMISAASCTRRDRVLDVACGRGAASLAFAERCGQVVGLETVAEPLVNARKEAVRRGLDALFIQGEVERLAFADGTFDGAFCRFSFHHTVRPEVVFAEMLRVVRPGGWLLIADMTAPDDPAQAILHNELERLCDPTHAQAMSIAEFEQMFARHGCETAMRVARDSRISVDDWVTFGGATPANAARLRDAAAQAAEQGSPRFVREGEHLRVLHTSVTFVVEKPG